MKKSYKYFSFSLLVLFMGCAANFQNHKIENNNRCTFRNAENITKSYNSSIAYYSIGVDENAKYLAIIFDETLEEKIKLNENPNWFHIDLSNIPELEGENNLINPNVFDQIDSDFLLFSKTYKFEPRKIVNYGTESIQTFYINGYNSTLQIYNCKSKRLIAEYNLEAASYVKKKQTFNDSLYINDAAINLINDLYYIPKFTKIANDNGITFEKMEKAEALVSFLAKKILNREFQDKILLLNFHSSESKISAEISFETKKSKIILEKLKVLGIILSYKIHHQYTDRARIEIQLSNKFFYGN